MKDIGSAMREFGRLWLFGAGLSALIGLAHGVLTFYGFI